MDPEHIADAALHTGLATLAVAQVVVGLWVVGVVNACMPSVPPRAIP